MDTLYYFIKIPHPSGFNQYIRLSSNNPPEILELTQNEANKRSYEERISLGNISDESKMQLKRIFPHEDNEQEG